MSARAALQAYAIAAADLEAHKRATNEAEDRLLQAEQQAVDLLYGAGIQLPIAVALVDGRTVTIDDVAEDYNYHLEYTIAESL